ncbi:type II secretion system protein [bacterium]|nr:type II secretion system protein [bacterium]
MKHCKAFTLSEVLIALVIIGVIAAITIPLMIANAREQEVRTALKKAHSIVSQALRFYYIDYGVLPKGIDFEARTFKDVFKEHFNILQDYGLQGFYSTEKNQDLYKTYDGSQNLDQHIFDDGQFVLNDGMFIMIENPNFGASRYNRVIISVDINGHDKNPNRLGKDLFMFQVDNEGKLLPMGRADSAYPEAEYCTTGPSTNMNGAGCTAKMMRKGR